MIGTYYSIVTVYVEEVKVSTEVGHLPPWDSNPSLTHHCSGSNDPISSVSYALLSSRLCPYQRRQCILFSVVFTPSSPSQRGSVWVLPVISLLLKVHKHEIILNFFLPKSNPCMPLVNFRKKFRFFSFDFRQHCEVKTFSQWLSIRETKFFWRDIQKKIFLKKFTLVLIDGFLNGVSKFRFFMVKICIIIWNFWVIFENYSMRMLSVRANGFIAHWAYKETISSHTEHTRNEFSRMLSQR
jgi:hypothetical protein